MLLWAMNTLNLYDVYKQVDPLKKKVADMTAKQETNEKALLET